MMHLGVAAGVADVLRLAADDRAGIDVVVAADRDVAHQGDVVFQPRAAADADVRADDAEGADLDIVVDFGAGVDRHIVGNVGGHRRGSFTSGTQVSIRHGRRVLDVRIHADVRVRSSCTASCSLRCRHFVLATIARTSSAFSRWPLR